MRNLHLLHVVPDLRFAAGGIAASVRDLFAALAAEGVESTAAAFAIDEDSPYRKHTTVIAERDPLRLFHRLSNALVKLKAEASTDVVVQSHGLWSMINHAAVAAARATGAPLVISPHGMLMPWAREHKALRKTVAWRLYQRRDLASAALIHVTSEAEREACVHNGIAGPFAVIPWGVETRLLPLAVSTPQGGERTLLFLGRVHPIKNLDTLIAAFAEVAPPGWRLLIVGPDEIGHRAKLENLATEFGVSQRVTFEEPCYGEAKSRLLTKADVLVLPSHSENHGAVVAEALAHGTPAIASTGAPWSALETERCGWWVAPNRSSIENVLREALFLSRDQLAVMGARGQAYAAQKLNWASAAKQLVEQYRGLVERAA